MGNRPNKEQALLSLNLSSRDELIENLKWKAVKAVFNHEIRKSVILNKEQ